MELDRSIYEYKYCEGQDASTNKNVEWLRYPPFWWCYVFLIVFFVALLRVALHETPIGRDWGLILSITSFIHNAIFFYAFHWIKGSPDEFSQGEYNGLTLWEQIDGGLPWTRTKKAFFLVPTLLILAASYVSDYNLYYLSFNMPVYLLMGILPKIPAMHRIRLFGINSTPGIDDMDTAKCVGACILGRNTAGLQKDE